MVSSRLCQLSESSKDRWLGVGAYQLVVVLVSHVPLSHACVPGFIFSLFVPDGRDGMDCEICKAQEWPFFDLLSLRARLWWSGSGSRGLGRGGNNLGSYK